MNPLCENCGACCMKMDVPPFNEHYRIVDPDDRGYWLLPEELRQELYAAWASDEPFKGKPCIWFDTATRLCKHYEFRPEVCVTFEPGNWVCIEDRESNLNSKETRELSLLESGVILAGCVIGMVLIAGWCFLLHWLEVW